MLGLRRLVDESESFFRVRENSGSDFPLSLVSSGSWLVTPTFVHFPIQGILLSTECISEHEIATIYTWQPGICHTRCFLYFAG